MNQVCPWSEVQKKVVKTIRRIIVLFRNRNDETSVHHQSIRTTVNFSENEGLLFQIRLTNQQRVGWTPVENGDFTRIALRFDILHFPRIISVFY
ncbi:unnamed protein product [Acanthoscelides obtectus]|uniref:Uncharacterized protein n=1 Tax=Acanthoscelides obtectus TaxID=200917 RepID=A0A9P0LKZ7_ACAOB|nr:unnamed protein product [Acanthoscelides obtectus]CAK1634987.1 hypothetical protein AOBTE_LOCUS8987 [Acanthoscelides obtectus]